MPRRLLPAVVGSVFFVASALGADQSALNATDGSNPILQYGAGASESCGAYLAAAYGLAPGTSVRMQRDGRTFEDHSRVLLQWAMGFLTAVNVVRAYENPPRPVQLETDEPAVAAWLLKICAESPTENLSAAMTRLVIELGQK